MKKIIGLILILSLSNSVWAQEWNPLQLNGLKQGQWDKIRAAYLALDHMPQLNEIKRDSFQSLLLQEQVSDGAVETTKFQQFYKGIRVVGAMALHHRGIAGEMITSSVQPLDLDIQASLPLEEAVSLALAQAGDLVLESKPQLEIRMTGEEQTPTLVYSVPLEGRNFEPGHEVILNAHSGALIADIPEWQEALSASVVLSANARCQQTDPYGRVTNLNPTLCDQVIPKKRNGPKADAAALLARRNSDLVLKYYRTVHGRSGLDGRGSLATSVVHVGKAFNNAFWSAKLQIMAYGDGDGITYGNFASGLDVAGHEMTHGVISSTAKLIYSGESGATNEAIADFFGMMVFNGGTGDWDFGKAIFLKRDRAFRNSATPEKFLASFITPDGKIVKKPYPKKVSEKFLVPAGVPCVPENDICYVHANSTIMSHAGYLIFRALGKASAEKLIFLTMSQFLTPGADFKTTRDGMLRACRQSLNKTSCLAVADAFKEIGI